MAKQPGKIEWHRMGWRWWLEAAVKLGFLGSIAWIVTTAIGDQPPRWAIGAGLFLIFLLGVSLWPNLPREGEETLDFKTALLGPFIVSGFLLAVALIIAALFVLFFVLPAFTAPLLQPIFEWLEINKIAVLLFLILLALIGIYQRLASKK